MMIEKQVDTVVQVGAALVGMSTVARAGILVTKNM